MCGASNAFIMFRPDGSWYNRNIRVIRVLVRGTAEVSGGSLEEQHKCWMAGQRDCRD